MKTWNNLLFSKFIIVAARGTATHRQIQRGIDLSTA